MNRWLLTVDQEIIIFFFILLIITVKELIYGKIQHKKPIHSVMATVVSIERKAGTYKTRHSDYSFSYEITFITNNGIDLLLYACKEQLQTLSVGMSGTLTYKGRFLVAFESKTAKLHLE